ncbi:MAG: hypothetical protein A3H45_14290 [Ignavibacteria bacterium RIFCSPLOWO2_02_FULL_55_14]|nr:MAG: hypothetical protein A3H45_14290 [Ignavibacteria bacterium RIFCSPLOWO2_02_FULL_55_14]
MTRADHHERNVRSEDMLTTVIDTVGEGITFSDEKGTFEIFNKKFEELTGYTKEEANAADDFSALIHIDPAAHRAGLDRLREVMEKGSIHDVETEIRTKTGDVKTVSVSTRLVQRSHRKMFLSVYRDITERKRTLDQLQSAMEAANTAARAKADFLATMSHEIRTPLNGVIGMTDILMHTDLTAEQLEYVETLRTSGETLLTVINDILDYSKIENGKLDLDLHPFDIVACIEDVYDILSYKAREKNLDLLYIVDTDIPRTLLGDETRIRQILLNLAGNAVKFTSRGDVLIQVKTIRSDGASLELQVDVRDSGIGISPEGQSMLFRSFTQVDSSTTRKFGGTGLGLAISRRLVDLMGGRIWVTSEVNVGSTFSFTIRVSALPESESPTKHSVRSVTEILAGKRIIIVDDNRTNLEILKQQSILWGMLPALTASPKEALTWIERSDRYDIGIFDMHMPDMNGLQLARAVRRSAAGQSLPLILLTSHGPQSELAAEVAALFTASVTKPVRSSNLLEMIASSLTGRRASELREGKKPENDEQLSTLVPLRILVAEDNGVNQKLILRLLQKLGYAATLTSDGREAVAAATATEFDVILMDIHMPEMDGLEATRAILGLPGRTVSPVILALTAAVMQEDMDQCSAAGMKDFISKPVHLSELRKMLLKWGSEVLKSRSVGEVPAASEPHLLERLRQLCVETDPDFVHNLVGNYLPDTETKVKLLSKQLEDENFEQLRQTAHALKGGALNMGAHVLGGMCGALQVSVEKQLQDDMRSFILKIGEQWPLAKKEFEQFLLSGKPSEA